LPSTSWACRRSIGAAIFGHFGDRIGRKKTLVTTLLMTGFATFAVGAPFF
jgi:MFS family permease